MPAADWREGWSTLAELGVTGFCVPEAKGGVGLRPDAAVAVAMQLLTSSTSIDDSGHEVADRWYHNYLWGRALTISGGASEIIRGIIGRQLLSLPRA
ncbi:hypothetical protein FMEAI12_5130023 [Parafrankia sp. Ea1.12]|nr:MULTISPECIES: hypothetical protein [unclassified Parafrankia]SQD99163.1 hypothetical protein FMEAI12_5130023 [Parafrankia sp. Ea1.12]